ncbi:hypothetical protein AB0L70_30730 [Kribbella sp. NPDC051952]|uniref:hypothetical protein n=1 Tax=Kribbella sp. NPDC051952 TaxID=3154851 RepID=UPI00341E6110
MNTTGVDHDLRRVPREWLDALELAAGSTEPVATYAPVLALTISREDEGSRQVLGCVRSPEENRTHPGVLSSPTVRIRGVEDFSGLKTGPVVGEVPVWLSAHVDQLLGGKLAADSVVTAGLTPDFVQVWQAHSVIGIEDGQPVTEPLTMINVHISVPAGVELFPHRTTSYSWIGFVSEERHALAVAQRDAELLNVSFGGETPIVYGLCTLSTANMLKATTAVLVS